jgi:holo-[acyl-carrier protein] synthase
LSDAGQIRSDAAGLRTVPAIRAGAAVISVGIDVVAVERFAAAIARTPSMIGRLFRPAELRTPAGHERGPASLAARFAVKEAVAKALGVPPGMDWHHCHVVTADRGRPELRVTDSVLAAASALGIVDWRVSLSHDAGIAAAIVLALGAS